MGDGFVVVICSFRVLGMEAIGSVVAVGYWGRWLLGFVIPVVVASKIVGLRRERQTYVRTFSSRVLKILAFKNSKTYFISF